MPVVVLAGAAGGGGVAFLCLCLALYCYCKTSGSESAREQRKAARTSRKSQAFAVSSRGSITPQQAADVSSAKVVDLEMVGLQKSRPLPPGDLDEAVAQPVAQPAPAVEAAPVRRRVEEMRITFPLGAPLGVGLIQKDGKVVVDLVQPTSAAAAVPVGATIQEINGTSCEVKGMKEVMAMIVDVKSAGEVTATFLVELAGVLEA